MKKFFKLIPAFAVIIGTTAIPLVSCNKGGGEQPKTPLCFTDVADDGTTSSISFNIDGSLPDIYIQYSYDQTNWHHWLENDIIELEDGQSVYVKNLIGSLSDDTNTFSFVMTGKIAASGNVNSMVNYEELTPYCFNDLFDSCDSLIQAPTLPATTLAEGCYCYMFWNCSSLEKTPDLPATTLVEHCYDGMFQICTSLISVCDLPATKLAPWCYSSMFNGCTSLEEIPKLPVAELAEGCYCYMFDTCTSLDVYEVKNNNNYDPTRVICDFTNVDLTPNRCVDGMFTYTGGSFVGQPTNKIYCWTNALKFTSEEDESSVSYTTKGTVDTSGIQYSFDGDEWKQWAGESIPLSKNNFVYIRNTNNELSNSDTNYLSFVMTGKIAASENVNSMINYGKLKPYCYFGMFEECSSLTAAPKLPTTQLAEGCYEDMFCNCMSLTSAPKLPATTLAKDCYYCMFSGCSSLIVSENRGETLVDFTNISVFPEESVYGMFSGTMGNAPDTPTNQIYGITNDLKFTNVSGSTATISYSLDEREGEVDTSGIQYSFDEENWNSWSDSSTTVTLNDGDSVYVCNTKNELSSSQNSCFYFNIKHNEITASGNVNSMINYSELKPYCFAYLFYDCDSLITAPELPATKLAEGCYSLMFYSCESLTKVTELPAATLTPYCYFSMFEDCSALNVTEDTGSNLFIDLTDIDLSPDECVENMFLKTGGSAPATPTNKQYYWN